MNFKQNESEQKLRGGYYTPAEVARFLVEWACDTEYRSILEPSCGDGIFIDALAGKVGKNSKISFDGVELSSAEAEKAEVKTQALSSKGIRSQIYNKDFFSWITNGKADHSWDVILGNPPYIRYQYFDNEQRKIAADIFSSAGVSFSKRTNAWVPFVIASVKHLAPKGRLAMVIPSEILHIQHAQGLRLMLEQEMESIVIVNIRDMVFEGALQGVVMLLGQKRAALLTPRKSSAKKQTVSEDVQKTRMKIVDIDAVSDLEKLDIDAIVESNEFHQYNGEWMKALLSETEPELLEKVTAYPGVKLFHEIADVDIGIVTGSNDFFVVDSETQKKYELEEISSPMLARSNLIKGIIYTAKDHLKNAEEGYSVHFLSFPKAPLESLPALMQEYLRSGEAQELHTRYKCRIREPWYVVPYVWTAELSMLKRCHFYPRIVLNEAAAHSTDTAYRMTMRKGYEQRAKDLTFSFLNSLSFLYAELLGRHYAGGVLELVPSEVEQIPIPLLKTTEENLLKVDSLIRSGSSLKDLVNFTDEIILKKGLKMSDGEIERIRAIHQRLIKRRLRK